MPIPTGELNVSKISAKMRIYSVLKDWIISDQLKPGEKVSDLEISNYFHVSRTPVREAFQLLESQNLLISYPGKATVVTEIDFEHIEHLYEPLSALQQLATSSAAEKADAAQISRLYELNQICKEISHQKKQLGKEDILALINADRDFHYYVLDIAENEYIQKCYDILWMHILRLEYRFFTESLLELSYQEHEDIIRSIQAHDPEGAKNTVRTHWNRAMKTLLDYTEIDRQTHLPDSCNK